MWQGLPQRLRHVPFRVALNERLDEPGAGSRSFETKSSSATCSPSDSVKGHIWMQPIQGISCWVLHRIRLKTIYGCSLYWHLLICDTSNSAYALIWMQSSSKSSFSKSTGYGEKLEWMQKFSWTDISSSIRFGNKPEWMQKFSWTGLFAPIRFDDKPKRMEILCLSRQTT